MQRAVAIALAGGLLAASAGAFGLAQVLKLERSPIEAIQVDPTPNHGRGVLDRHDSALFSPSCTAPCLPAARVQFTVHTSGPVRAQVIGPGGAVVRDLGTLPHPRGIVVARWDGRDVQGAVAPAGTYRLKVAVSGRHIELLNPLVLDTSVGLLGTNVSRRVISPDCDSHGDRVTVVVRGREQLAGLQLQVRQTTLEGDRLIRTVRLKQRARALAISWPPYAGKRCTTAEDALGLHLRVIARDVAGNTRAIDEGRVLARGVAITLPARSVVAGKRLRVGLSADAPSLRVDLARLGGATSVLVRGAHGPSAVARLPGATRGGIYLVAVTHAKRTYRAPLAVRGAQPARVALVVRALAASMNLSELEAYQRKLDGFGIRFDVLTQREIAAGALAAYAVVVAPPSGGAKLAGAHGAVVTSLGGIVPGLGS